MAFPLYTMLTCVLDDAKVSVMNMLVSKHNPRQREKKKTLHSTVTVFTAIHSQVYFFPQAILTYECP